MSFSATDVHAFLTRPLIQSFLRTHPNNYVEHIAELGSDDGFDGLLDASWPDLVSANAKHDLLAEIRSLQLDRTPSDFGSKDEKSKGFGKVLSEQGMSPKKLHEVSRMVRYILHWIQTHYPTSLGPPNANSTSEQRQPHLRIVDVGAGQGYLTRALKFHLPYTHILALDADENQTKGSQRWETRLLPPPTRERPAIHHKTILVSSETLYSAISEWLEEEHDEDGATTPSTPILFVALHACGSLTIDILRGFLSNTARVDGGLWSPAGVIAVGCCYNLMNPGDFPLSQAYASLQPPLNLPTAAYHLAAQIPSQWLSSDNPPTPTPSTSLAVRKVTWRAMLGRYLTLSTILDQPDDTLGHLRTEPSSVTKSATVPAHWSRRPDTWHSTTTAESTRGSEPREDAPAGTGETPAMRRLGKLHKSVYDNWDTFLQTAEKRMGIRLPSYAFDGEPQCVEECNAGADGGSAIPRGRDKVLERRLGSLHAWRCLLGPVVESAILHDRVLWIRERLGGLGDFDRFDVELVNLFDQATGSGRNVAIVISPIARS